MNEREPLTYQCGFEQVLVTSEHGCCRVDFTQVFRSVTTLLVSVAQQTRDDRILGEMIVFVSQKNTDNKKNTAQQQNKLTQSAGLNFSLIHKKLFRLEIGPQFALFSSLFLLLQLLMQESISTFVHDKESPAFSIQETLN
jgi:hypothetical protein